MPDDEEREKPYLMPFWDHVEEFIKQFKAVLYVLVTSFIALMVLPGNLSFLENPSKNYQPLISIIFKIVRDQTLPQGVELIGFDLTAPLTLYMNASLLMAFAITFPVLFYQMYVFFNPAIYPEERGELYPFLASFLILIIIGLAFGYKVLSPSLILGEFSFFSAVGAERVLSVKYYYGHLFTLTIATGLIFTLPVFLVLLVKFGIIETKGISKNRQYLYGGLFIFSMFITPGGSMIGNALLFGPMIILMEVGLFFARRYERNNEIKPIHWFSHEMNCKYCESRMEDKQPFCPICGRSQR